MHPFAGFHPFDDHRLPIVLAMKGIWMPHRSGKSRSSHPHLPDRADHPRPGWPPSLRVLLPCKSNCPSGPTISIDDCPLAIRLLAIPLTPSQSTWFCVSSPSFLPYRICWSQLASSACRCYRIQSVWVSNHLALNDPGHLHILGANSVWMLPMAWTFNCLSRLICWRRIQHACCS